MERGKDFPNCSLNDRQASHVYSQSHLYMMPGGLRKICQNMLEQDEVNSILLKWPPVRTLPLGHILEDEAQKTAHR